jgi:hypothetical protein
MKKHFFYGFAVTMAVMAIAFSGIPNSNSSVTNFIELKAKAEKLCYPMAESECQTPNQVYYDMCCEGCGHGSE